MEILNEHILNILHQLPANVTLVAVTKTRPVEVLQQAYDLGLRDFGENRVQEMIEKQPVLPADIRWHQIGHLQTNKVKYIAPFVHLVHSVDSLRLLEEINRQALKNNRTINCLLQIYIATEESKFGLDESELNGILENELCKSLTNIRICGLMGMASFSDDLALVRSEFAGLKQLFVRIKKKFFADSPEFSILSTGMSGDYLIAIEEGSTMVRIGTALFGER
ncbi:MAG: YggS family pyridoxal phosphate-dependent enzyme [Bacteroidales bacterium]|nr:YggS family pyridoxal phosphate-dependent enzyme [Bacteroidales bacterium]